MKTNWLFLPLALLVAISFGCDANNAGMEGDAETDDIDAVVVPADPGVDATDTDAVDADVDADVDAAAGETTAPEADETPAVDEEPATSLPNEP